MILAYRGYSTIITAPIISLITLFLTFGLDSHLMANYTLVYMDGFAGFVKNYFPLFLTGAIFDGGNWLCACNCSLYNQMDPT